MINTPILHCLDRSCASKIRPALRSVKRKHLFHKLFAANTYLNAPFAAPKMTYGCYKHVYMVTDGSKGLTFSHLPQSDDCLPLYESNNNMAMMALNRSPELSGL